MYQILFEEDREYAGPRETQGERDADHANVSLEDKREREEQGKTHCEQDYEQNGREDLSPKRGHSGQDL